jgi:hypothetical protein
MCPTDLAEILELAADQAADGYLSESPGWVEGKIRLVNERVISRVGQMMASPADFGMTSCLVKSSWEDDQPLTREELWDDGCLGRDVVFRFTKSALPDTVRFVLPMQGLNRALIAEDLSDKCVIEVLGSFQPVKTLCGVIRPWGAAADVRPAGKVGALASPLKVVRCYGTAAHVPADLGHLLSRSAGEHANACGPVIEAWRAAALQVLPFAIASEVWEKDGRVLCGVRGPVTRDAARSALGDDLRGSLELLTEAVAWVYSPTEQVEVRHGLLASELARLWPQAGPESWDAVLADRLCAAYETARTSYNLHVQGLSAESLRALADLRKALIEESARVQKFVSDLLSGLWRDFIVAAGGLITHYIALEDDKPGSRRWIIWACISFVVANGLLSFLSQARAMWLAQKSFDAWKNRVYSFVAEADFRVLATEPMDSVRRMYWIVAAVVGVLYVAMVVVLGVSLQAPDLTPASVQPAAQAPDGGAS